MGCSESKESATQPVPPTKQLPTTNRVVSQPSITPFTKPDSDEDSDEEDSDEGHSKILKHRSTSYLQATTTEAKTSKQNETPISVVVDLDPEVVSTEVDVPPVDEVVSTEVDVPPVDDSGPRTVRIPAMPNVGLGMTLAVTKDGQTIRVASIDPTGSIAKSGTGIQVGDVILGCDKVPDHLPFTPRTLIAAITAWQSFCLMIRTPTSSTSASIDTQPTSLNNARSFKPHVDKYLFVATMIDEITTLTELNQRVVKVLAKLKSK